MWQDMSVRGPWCGPRRSPSGVQTVPQGAVVQLGGGLELFVAAGVRGDLGESLHHFDVALDEAGFVVPKAVLLAERLHERACLAEVVAGQTGVQVVLDLELKAAMEPVQPLRAVDVHGRLELHGEPLVAVVVVGAAVVGVHVKVRQRDLHVEEAGDKVGDDQEEENVSPGGEGGEESSEPREEAEQGDDLERLVLDLLGGQEQQPRLHVEVEAGEAHDGVEEQVLVADEEAADDVVHAVLTAVVGAPEGSEHLLRDGDERDVLDVWVVLDRVAHDVVDVVGALPPGEGDAASEVAEGGAPEEVQPAHVGKGVVADVVADEGELLPENAEEDRSEDALLEHEGGVEHDGKSDGEDGELDDVVPGVRFEEVAFEELLAQGAVLADEVGHLVVGHLADVERREQRLVHAGGVVVGEGVGNVLARQVGDGEPAAGVGVHVRRDVVAVAVDDDPGVVALVVLGHLGHGEVGAYLFVVLRRVEGRDTEGLALVLAQIISTLGASPIVAAEEEEEEAAEAAAAAAAAAAVVAVLSLDSALLFFWCSAGSFEGEGVGFGFGVGFSGFRGRVLYAGPVPVAGNGSAHRLHSPPRRIMPSAADLIPRSESDSDSDESAPPGQPLYMQAQFRDLRPSFQQAVLSIFMLVYRGPRRGGLPATLPTQVWRRIFSFCSSNFFEPSPSEADRLRAQLAEAREMHVALLDKLKEVTRERDTWMTQCHILRMQSQRLHQGHLLRRARRRFGRGLDDGDDNNGPRIFGGGNAEPSDGDDDNEEDGAISDENSATGTESESGDSGSDNDNSSADSDSDDASE
eukprot:CAMPEP_0195509232 /NCGR_PEP_ID=MMETSP0794_2-20130614/2227_1 /TAXON_ID=515487 /ORGANISM="Stephanopyxis turris, Strain CCMP 815" /LENGTH=802 /DNA_ID=CAMNT_0040636397 /DNA_START=117 /DNA_END=2526 /DNA_ORIENTATION=-